VIVTVEDDEGGSALAVDDYLTKPIDRSRLGRWLDRVAAGDGRATVAVS